MTATFSNVPLATLRRSVRPRSTEGAPDRMLLTTFAVDTAAFCSPPPEREVGDAAPPPALLGVSEQALSALRPTAATAREKRGRFENTVAPQDDSKETWSG
ncbi:hypothetical protein GCM10027596_35370 [Nocardioides korecus]